MEDNSTCSEDPGLPFCKVCPDHEACATGMPWKLVMEAHKND